MADRDDPIRQFNERIRDVWADGNKYVRLTVSEAVRLLNAIEQARVCHREHVPYVPSSRSDNRFFGDENNG